MAPNALVVKAVILFTGPSSSLFIVLLPDRVNLFRKPFQGHFDNLGLVLEHGKCHEAHHAEYKHQDEEGDGTAKLLKLQTKRV